MILEHRSPRQMLSDHEREQFATSGYIVRPAAIPQDRVENYCAVLGELVERGRGLQTSDAHWALELDEQAQPIPGFLSKVQGVCAVEPRIRELAAEPAVARAVESLLGPEVDFFGTKFFPKLPGGSTSTHWHQDNWYWSSEPGKVVSAAIYLEDTDADSGCLRVIPGSHLGPAVEHVQSANGAWSTVDEAQAVDVACPAGTVVLFSANLVHGAYDNFSDRSSYRTAWHYTPSSYDLERYPSSGHPDRHSLSPVDA